MSNEYIMPEMAKIKEIVEKAFKEIELEIKKIKQSNERKNKWVNAIGGEYYVGHTNFNDLEIAEAYTNYTEKNAKKHYAEFVLQSIFKRDYTPEKIDWSDENQYKYFLVDGSINSGDSYYTTRQRAGILYCTAKPDVDKIKEEMSELFEVLWG